MPNVNSSTANYFIVRILYVWGMVLFDEIEITKKLFPVKEFWIRIYMERIFKTNKTIQDFIVIHATKSFNSTPLSYVSDLFIEAFLLQNFTKYNMFAISCSFPSEWPAKIIIVNWCCVLDLFLQWHNISVGLWVFFSLNFPYLLTCGHHCNSQFNLMVALHNILCLGHTCLSTISILIIRCLCTFWHSYV